MVCSAQLACRSPPRLSRCRLVFPEETGIGVVPHRAAKPAGRDPVGVVAGGDQQLRGGEGPEAGFGEQLGGQLGDQFGEVMFGVVDLSGEVVDASGEPAEGESGGAGRVGEVFGVEPGARGDLVSAGQRLQLVAKPHGGGDDHLMQRVDRCGAGLHRAAPGHEDHPDPFHEAAVGLRGRGSDTS